MRLLATPIYNRIISKYLRTNLCSSKELGQARSARLIIPSTIVRRTDQYRRKLDYRSSGNSNREIYPELLIVTVYAKNIRTINEVEKEL